MLKLLNRFEDGVISALLVSITLLVFFEVILRFVFNTGIHWAQEATLLLSAWMILLGASWAVREKAHIAVDALTSRLEEKTAKKVLFLAIALCLVYCGLFFYGSWVYTAKLYKFEIELDDIPMQKWLAQSVLVFGFVFLAARLVEMGFAVAKDECHGFHQHQESILDQPED